MYFSVSRPVDPDEDAINLQGWNFGGASMAQARGDNSEMII